METKQFTIAELEYLFNNEGCRAETLAISKQLLAQLELLPSVYSVVELETMIHDYEAFQKEYKSGNDFSDIQNDMAGKLPKKIMWITMQLIRLMKELELREAVREYLKRPSTDGAPIRQEQRRKLAELVKEKNHE